LTTNIHLVPRVRSGVILVNPPVCIHGVERNSFSILLLVLMVHLCSVKHFHFDIKLCTVYHFSLNFRYTFLSTVMVSYQTNICFTYSALLGLLFDTVVASIISLLQYQLKYLSSKKLVSYCIFSVAWTVLKISFTADFLLIIIHVL